MTLGKPQATYQEDHYTFRWDSGFVATIERFSESRDDIRAELTVTSGLDGSQLYFGRLLLMGPRSRADVVRALNQRDDEPDWQGMLEQVCTLSLRRYREGAPAIDLVTGDVGEAGRYLVRPFVFDDAVNMLYGSGDSGKSLFTMFLALVVASDQEIGGLIPERSGPVLILDWEDGPATHKERLHGLAVAAGVTLSEGQVIYRRMDASLKESVREIRKDIAKYQAVLVIVDSIGMACGGDPNDAGAIIEAMLAARSLGVPSIAVHHIAKTAKDKSNPYGSVYATNEARMSWLVESERDQGVLTQVFTNHKANRGARHDRMQYQAIFTEDEYEHIERIDMRQASFTETKTVGGGGQKWKIADLLKTGGMTVKEIADALGYSRESTRKVLARSEGDLFTRLDGGLWGVQDKTRQDTERHVFGTRQDTGSPLGDLSGSPVLPEGEEKEEEGWKAFM